MTDLFANYIVLPIIIFGALVLATVFDGRGGSW